MTTFNAPNFGDDEEYAADGVIDLSQVEEVAYEPLAPGVYDAEVEEVNQTVSASSNRPMLAWTFRVQTEDEQGKPVARKTYFNTSLIPEQLGRIKRLVLTLDPNYDLRSFRPSEAGSEFAGRPCRLRLGVRVYEGKRVNQVKEVLPAPESAVSFLGR